jgi:uncharacterized protein YegP (UPF0339 family)
MRCELYTDTGGKHRWRMVSSNGQTTASSGEAFSSAGSARTAAKNFVAKCGTWEFEVYADKGGNHRWRAVASNGQTVASSGQGFSTRSNARRAAFNVRDKGGAATVG